MTSLAAKAGGAANNPPPDAATVQSGAVVMWLDGRFGPVPPRQAWSEWLFLQGSPIPASRDRAAAIRGALNEIGYLTTKGLPNGNAH